MRLDLARSESRANGSRQKVALDLHYKGQPTVIVRGPVTGSAYEFSSAQPVQPVDLRDARFILANPLFTLSK